MQVYVARLVMGIQVSKHMTRDTEPVLVTSPISCIPLNPKSLQEVLVTLLEASCSAL